MNNPTASAVAGKNAAAILEENAERAVAKILSLWPSTPAIPDACTAAMKLGHLEAVRILTLSRCKELLRDNLTRRGITEGTRQEINDALGHGRSTNLPRNEIWNCYVSKAANDNKPKSLQLPEQVRAAQKDRFQVTWFDDVDKSPAKESIVKGLIGAGEFSLWVAKPGTAKSVLLCDIGCHIAAGIDWHGRTVKKSLVVFFAAERKALTERRIAAWRKKHNVAGIPFRPAGMCYHQTLSKRYADAILTPPYNAARKLQSVLRHDECEFIGNADQIGELQRRAGARYIADNARVLVAAVVDLGSFHDANAWGNPSFDHFTIPNSNAATVAGPC